MLVPAMAYAWWLVSLSIPLPGPKEATDVAATASETTTTDVPASGAPTDDNEAPPADDDDDAEAVGQRVVVKIVTPQLVRVAKTFLDLPMGTERYVAIDGSRYVFVLERHYHPPGFVGGPHGWHKGVTVYELQ